MASGLRLIVVDADLPRRLAGQLRDRGRDAVSAAELSVDRYKDPDLLRELSARYEARLWILVTGDDAMPAEHGDILIETGATIATIHPEHPIGLTQDAWRRDVVHRWAHAFQTQTDANIRRYKSASSQLWAPRRRHLRAAAAAGWKPWRREDIPATDQVVPEADSARHDADRLPGFE
jgi:hypothetical protein